MTYCDFKADDAIAIVTQALKERGFANGIDIKSTNGSYGDWIRDYEKDLQLQKKDENKENDLNILALRPLRKSKRLKSNSFLLSDFLKDQESSKKITNRIEVVTTNNSKRLAENSIFNNAPNKLKKTESTHMDIRASLVQ